MKTLPPTPLRSAVRCYRRGVSLVETIVAIGVLAVVAPLVLATVLRANDTGVNARTDTRAPAIVDACLSEIAQARKGASENLPSMPPGEDFPSGEGLLCLGFDRAGSLIGRVKPESYSSGIPQLNGKDVFYLVTLKGEKAAITSGSGGTGDTLTKLTLGIENPAPMPAAKRSQTAFVTKMP